MSSAPIDYWKRSSLTDPFLLYEDNLVDLLYGCFATEYASELANTIRRAARHDQWLEWFSLKDPITKRYFVYRLYRPNLDDYESIRKVCRRNRLHFDYICGVIYRYKGNNGYKNQYKELTERLRYDLLEVKFLLEQELVRDFFADRDHGPNVRRYRQAKQVRQWFEAAGRIHYAWMFDSRKYAEVFAAMPKDPKRRKPIKFVEYLEQDYWREYPAWSTSRTPRQQGSQAALAGPSPATGCRSIGSCDNPPFSDYLEPPPPYCESGSASNLSSTFGMAHESERDIKGSNDPLRDMMR